MLFDLSADETAEKNVIAQLKINCGSHFVQKIEGMLNDIELTEMLNKNYQSSPYSDKSMQTKFLIIAKTNWPTYKEMTIFLPLQLKAAKE